MNNQPVNAHEALLADPVFDCVVFSGGGAKGAYRAGAALAIERYRELEGVTFEICWIGATAGALNAAVFSNWKSIYEHVANIILLFKKAFFHM